MELDIFSLLKEKAQVYPLGVLDKYDDELYIKVGLKDFRAACLFLHQFLKSPVEMLFAQDQCREQKEFTVTCVFAGIKYRKWIFVSIDIPQDLARFDALSKEIYSAALFEREIKEMFGLTPEGSLDLRSLNLHDEVWPEKAYPLLKSFSAPKSIAPKGEYKFAKVQGDGVFEVPVGPVHAGIIGPGHFRFSVAGEPIINLEIRLGFTHRGIEKILEAKNIFDAVNIAERVSGDSSFAHSLAFCQAVEKICGLTAPHRALYLRGIMLELERMYNHVNDIGGIAVDVGFSFPAALASIIKESILQLNFKLAGSRYLKGINTIGGLTKDIEDVDLLLKTLESIEKDFKRLLDILNASVSFMDRVDNTGVLKRKTAEDFGVVGLAARACGIPTDLRRYFPGVYSIVKFNMAREQKGDVLARLKVRYFEFQESCRLIKEFLKILPKGEVKTKDFEIKEGFGLGFVEAWRGPVLYWIKIDAKGRIERCKIVDPSYRNWQGLSYAVLGDIIPDFPVSNKSFDLSYSGNDL